jgi:ABC-type uncharacterized transport system YnjBCD substrate-binding protein
MMNLFVLILLSAALLPAFASAAQAQNLDEVFRKASPTVVVRAKGRDVKAEGVVVNGMDEITVEGINAIV